MPNDVRHISGNPFRVLDVFADASQKEILANKGKFMAFNSVGKSVDRTLLDPALLPPMDLGAADVDGAYTQLHLPQTRVRHALMWFLCPDDETMLGALKDSDGKGADGVLSVFENHMASLDKDVATPLWLIQDVMLLCLLTGRYMDAYMYVSMLSKRVDEWLLKVGCETVAIQPTNLVEFFLEAVKENHVEFDIEGQIKEAFDELTEKVNKISADASLDSLMDLYSSSRKWLPLLKMAPDGLEHYYADIANKIAETFINAPQNYYATHRTFSNETWPRDKYRELVGYAERIMYGTSLLPKLQHAKALLDSETPNLPKFELPDPPPIHVPETTNDGMGFGVLIMTCLFLICLARLCGSDSPHKNKYPTMKKYEYSMPVTDPRKTHEEMDSMRKHRKALIDAMLKHCEEMDSTHEPVKIDPDVLQ